MKPATFVALACASALALGSCAVDDRVTTSAAEAPAPVEQVAEQAAPDATVAAAPAAAPAIPAETTVAAVPVPTTPYEVFQTGGAAIAGADVVAYFTAGAYTPGSAEFTHEWGGATWQFASAENRDRFAADPLQYAPQYGGFCAWAVSQGYTAAVDPTAWKIVDNKLYLNFDARIQRRWERDIPGHIARANNNWPSVLSN